METPRVSTIAELDIPSLTHAFNLVYEGYLMPATVNDAWMEEHLRLNDIDPHHSPLMLDPTNGKVIGLAILGVRGDRGWVGGFGIAPGYRGKGLSHHLMEQVIDQARMAGVTDLVLEVLQPNEPAIQTYQRAGFQRNRALLIFHRAAGVPSGDTVEELQSVVHAELLSSRQFYASPRPSWQREAASLGKMDGLEGLRLGDDSGWAIVKGNSERQRIYDIAARTTEDAFRLLTALTYQFPGAAMVIVNEPEDSPLIPALGDTGWSEAIHQWEMTRAVT